MGNPHESANALPTATAPNQARVVPGKEERQRIVQALEAQALGNPDPVQAALGLMACDSVRLTHSLVDNLRERQRNREGVNGRRNEDLYRDTDQVLTSMRQTGRFFHMMLQLQRVSE
jgi:hypothetical protein